MGGALLLLCEKASWGESTARRFRCAFLKTTPSRVVFREISQKTMFLSHFLR